MQHSQRVDEVEQAEADQPERVGEDGNVKVAAEHEADDARRPDDGEERGRLQRRASNQFGTW